MRSSSGRWLRLRWGLRCALFLALCGFCVPPHARAAGEWQVPQAALRYRLDLSKRPTHPTAGFFAQLPDGGLLRNTFFATDVLTEDGQAVPSFLLWQNFERGFSIVFADPGPQVKSVLVYARTDRRPALWKAETGLTPSGLLCIHPGRETMNDAQALAKLGSVEAAVHVETKTGIPKAPLSIGGDDTGRPKPGAFYLLTYVEARDAGKFWIAPFFKAGAGEVLIDGAKLTPKPRSKNWGGDGEAFDLTKGLHRVEVFQTAPGKGPYESGGDTGLMYLTWAPPKERLKGVDARVLTEGEIAHSGTCTLHSVEAKDGSPLAAGVVRPGLVFWFENEEPLIVGQLEALTTGHPADTTYTWTLPDKATVEGKNAGWLFPGFREYWLKLTVKSGASVSQCLVPFFAFSTMPTSLEKLGHRETFRSILAAMLKAYPRAPDPVADWSEAYWNNLLRTTEGGEGTAVLRPLFAEHWETVRHKLAPGQLYALEDVFLDVVQRDDPKEALQWVQKFQPSTTERARQAELQFREGEMQMYYLGDHKAAAAIFTALAGLANEFGERARIRLGDLAFLEGDLNKATSFYADVQNRARASRNAGGVLPGGLVTNQLVKGGPPVATPPERGVFLLPFQKPAAPPPAAVKGGALQEVSLSENVQTLTEGDFLLEARKSLKEWEREFPLSKISGDFILRDSALAMKLGDWKRARPMLEAYCREIDASSFLPDAAEMLITCVQKDKTPPGAIREIIEKVHGRLKFHPVAAKLEAFLKTARK